MVGVLWLRNPRRLLVLEGLPPPPCDLQELHSPGWMLQVERRRGSGLIAETFAWQYASLHHATGAASFVAQRGRLLCARTQGGARIEMAASTWKPPAHLPRLKSRRRPCCLQHCNPWFDSSPAAKANRRRPHQAQHRCQPRAPHETATVHRVCDRRSGVSEHCATQMMRLRSR